MSGALHRQMRMLGTEFDRESIVTSQRRRRRPERWSGYVCVCFYVFVRNASKTSFYAGTRMMRPIDKSRIITLVITYW